MPKRTFFRLDEDKRERVIRTSIHEFRLKGFDGAKVGNIAQSAGIANGSIYQYFTDKHELFLYCVNWTLENFAREMERQLPLAALDVFEYLQTGLPERIKYCSLEPELAMFAHDLMWQKLDFPYGEKNTVREIRGHHVPKIAANGQKWGTLRSDVDYDAMIIYLTGVLGEVEEKLFYEAAADNFNVSDKQVEKNAAFLKTIMEMIKEGLSPRVASEG